MNTAGAFDAVPQGPRQYRSHIRRRGPWLGLVPPAVAGVAALWLVHGDGSTLRGALGFLLAVMAAPTLLVAGVPLTTGASVYGLALVGGAVWWLALSAVAARRATRVPVATWADFWREYAWLAAGVAVGAVLALVAADLVLGRALL
ncbi:MAG: hypothetical protein RLZ14_67 [Actinomycetota bacterium]|jgi:hypothetical protein